MRTSSLIASVVILVSACDFPRPREVPGGGDDATDAALVDAATSDAATADGATVDGSPPTSCGDSRVDPGEDCDSGGVDTADCDRDCTRPACGDGVFNVAAGEACDDGNTVDDGNGCDTQCRKNAVCGDLKVQSLFEACDDGGQVGGDGCSADCKEAVIAPVIPVSDRAGVDSNGNGTFDFMHNEDSTGEAIFGGFFGVGGGTLEEGRLAFEFDTRVLHRTYLMKEAHFTFFPNNLSGGPRQMQVRGYLGNGAVELSDMTVNDLITTYSAASTAFRSIDVTAFMQTAARQEFPFTGFLLRLESLPQDGLFNMGVSTSNFSDASMRPKLDMVYCVDSNHDGACD
jgi:cysteine-rich repeat protein